MASTISAGTTTTTALVYSADTSGVLQLQTNGTTTAVTIDTSQNVGIGTTSPSTKLNIVQNQNGASQVLLSNNTGGASSQVLFSATDGTNYGQFGMWGSGVSASGAQQPSNAFVYGSGGISYFTGGTHRWYYSTNTEAMRIDTSGNLYIGTTNQIGSGKVSVLFSGATQNAIEIEDSGTNSNATFLSFRNSGGTQIGYVARVGTTNAVVYGTTSDYRLKNVVGAVTGQGERIDALKPIDYTWKDGSQSARGFLAHEFQSVYADSVIGQKDAVDANGNPVYQGMQASTPELIADLVAEIQSLRARLKAANIA